MQRRPIQTAVLKIAAVACLLGAGCSAGDCSGSSEPAAGTAAPAKSAGVPGTSGAKGRALPPGLPVLEVRVDSEAGRFELRDGEGEDPAMRRGVSFEKDGAADDRADRRLAEAFRTLFERMEARGAERKRVEAWRRSRAASADSDSGVPGLFGGIGRLPGGDAARALEMQVEPTAPVARVEGAALAGGFAAAKTVDLTIGGAAPFRYGLVRRFERPGACLDEAGSERAREACWQLFEKGLGAASPSWWISVGIVPGGFRVRVHPGLPVTPGGGDVGVGGSDKKFLGRRFPFEDAERARELAVDEVTVERVAGYRKLYPWRKLRDFLTEVDRTVGSDEVIAEMGLERAPAPAVFVDAVGVPAGILVGFQQKVCGREPVEASGLAEPTQCGWAHLRGPYLGPVHFR